MTRNVKGSRPLSDAEKIFCNCAEIFAGVFIYDTSQ